MAAVVAKESRSCLQGKNNVKILLTKITKNILIVIPERITNLRTNKLNHIHHHLQALQIMDMGKPPSQGLTKQVKSIPLKQGL